MIAVLFIGFFALLVLGIPIALSLTMSATLVLWLDGMNMSVVVQKIFTAMDTYSLMAIPFFMIAGGLLADGGVSKRLTDFAKSLVGWLPGGFAIVVFLSSAFFGAISGSSAATVAAIGAIMVPAMLADGYPLKFALATVASGGFLGIIVPPSIPMVIYGMASGASVSDVFMGGFIPGFMLAGGMSVYSVIWAIRHKDMLVSHKFSIHNVWISFKNAILALIMPLIVLGGIYGGVFNATEAACVAVFYGLFVGVVIYKELNFKNIFQILRNSVVTTAMLLFVIAGATVFGLILTRFNVPQTVATGITTIATNRFMFWALVTVLLLIVGTFMDTCPAVMILTPIFTPALAAYDIDPVVFGVVMIINLGIGLCTPPVGLNLYVAAGLRKTTIENVVGRDLWFYLLAAVTVLVILMAIPQIIMFLPGLMIK